MKKGILVFISMLVALAATAFVAVLFGGSSMSAGEVVRGLLHPGAGDTATTIIWSIRLPRILLGMLVGMGLAVSGSVFQGMLRNPLADPYTLGISGGAAFGAAIGIVCGFAAKNVAFVPLFAFAGTLVTVALVYLAASSRQFSLSTLILSGVILGFLFSALVLLVIALSNAQKVHATMLWLMGDLSTTDLRLLKMTAMIVVPGAVLLSLFGRELNILSLGEEKAAHLGVETETVKKALFVIASLVTAACVSASGIIGFVGLIIPHVMRRISGPDHQSLVPLSALAGGIFLALCDTLARTVIAPVELPVGVITGLVGGIFFLVFLFKSGKESFL